MTAERLASSRSSKDGCLTLNGMPNKASNSRRRGEVEARMIGIYNAGEGSTESSIRSEASVKLAQYA